MGDTSSSAPPASIGDNQGPSLTSVSLPPIPYSMSESARVGVLNDIATALLNAGATITPIDRSAAYSQNGVTQRINDISNAANELGASPVLPIYTSTDYNSFSSIMNNIVTAIQAIP